MNWDRFFLGLAEYISTASKDPSTKTGAVIVGPNREVISVGYNGFARGVMDLESRYADRETKYKMIVHCESNAIILARRDLTGCTIYLHPFMPCAPCAGKIIQAGIKRVVAPYNDNPRWQADFRLTEEMLSEAVVKLDLIKESKWEKQGYLTSITSSPGTEHLWSLGKLTTPTNKFYGRETR